MPHVTDARLARWRILATAGRLALPLGLGLAMAVLAGGALAAVLFDTPVDVSGADVQASGEIEIAESDIAVNSAGQVYVAWEDDGGSGDHNDIYYSRLDDGGQATGVTRQSVYASVSSSHYPNLAVAGTQVYAAWVEGDVVTHRELTAGPIYTVPTSGSLSVVGPPDLAVEPGSGRMHIVFSGGVSGPNASDVLYSSRASGGWSTATVIYTHTQSPGAVGPRLALDTDRNLHAVLQNMVGAQYQIRYISATNTAGTVTWHPSQAIQLSSSPVVLPDIAVDSHGVIHVIWTEVDSPGLYCTEDYVVYARSTNSGATWSTPKRLNSTVHRVHNTTPYYVRARLATLPAAGGDQVYVVWEGDPVNACNSEALQEKVWLASSGNAGVSWSSPRQLSRSAGTLVSLRPAVATGWLSPEFSQTVHVAWSQQQANGKYRVDYVRGAPGSSGVYLPIVLKNR